MARKSRKKKKGEALEHVVRIDIPGREIAAALPTAAYVRLSVEKDNDDSIQTQASLLHRFIDSRPDMFLAETYEDNGYTGTNFDRPGFRRMMEDVQNGKIQCIVVKDLSRFGREFLETGYYIETLLPRLNVRLVSVNDNFDSGREEDRNSIAVPIKNMINEMYAKDFSRKVTAYNELHRQRGDMQIYRSVYGYSLDKENNRLVVNPETAPYVRMVFRWTLMGIGRREIVRRLTALEAVTPFQYKSETEQGKKLGKTDSWNTGKIGDMLQQKSYSGDKIFGERRKTLYKNLPEHHTPPEEWTVRRNAHEPLVVREDFDRVQGMLQETRKNAKARAAARKEERELVPNCLPGMVRCMECGKTMFFCRRRESGNPKNFILDGGFYQCKSQGCSFGGKVEADYLKMITMDQIHLLAKSICSRKELLLKMRESMCSKGAVISAKSRVGKLKMELEKADETAATLYENFSEGILDEEEYLSMKEYYTLKKEQLRESIREAEKQERLLMRRIEKFLELEKHLEEHLERQTFDGQLVQSLVEYISVGAGNAVEIRFQCRDVFEPFMEMMGT